MISLQGVVGFEAVDSRCGEGQSNEECMQVGEEEDLGVEGQR